MPILIKAAKEWSEGVAYFEDSRVRVQEFTQDDGDGELEWTFQIHSQISEAEHLQMVAVADIMRALEEGKVAEAKTAMLRLKELPVGPDGAVSQIARKLIDRPDYIQDSLIYQLGGNLEGVRFVLWKRDPDGSLAPGMFCPDIRTAFWLRTLLSAIGNVAGFRMCPKCGKAFSQKRNDQQYCSFECRESHRIARWRAKGGGKKAKDIPTANMPRKSKKKPRGAK
jgi:hypothetical protein